MGEGLELPLEGAISDYLQTGFPFFFLETVEVWYESDSHAFFDQKLPSSLNGTDVDEDAVDDPPNLRVLFQQGVQDFHQVASFVFLAE